MAVLNEKRPAHFAGNISLFIAGLLLQGSANLYAQDNAFDLMALTLEDLLNVEISAAGKKVQKVRDIPASVVVLSKQDIKNKGYRNMVQLIKGIPGYYIVEHGHFFDQPIGVRGFLGQEGTGVKILINGLDTVFSFNNQYSLDNLSIPVEAVERVEVVRGPMSVIYGSGAFFGVINIITRKDVEDDINSFASVRYGTNNEKSLYAGFNAGGVIGDGLNINVSVNARREHSQGPNYNLDRFVSDLDDYEANDFQFPGDDALDTDGRLGFENNYVDVSVTADKLTFSYYGANTNREYYAARATAAGVPSTYRTGAEHWAIAFNDKALDGMDYKIVYGVHEFDDQQRIRGAVNGIKQWSFDVVKDSNEYLEVHVNYDISDNLAASFGLSYHDMTYYNQFWDYNWAALFNSHEFTNYEREFVPDDHVTTRSIYSQFDYKISDALRVIAGGRFESLGKYQVQVKTYVDGFLEQEDVVPDGIIARPTSTQGNDDDGFKFTGRLAAIWHLNNAHSLKFLVGEATNVIGPSARSEAIGGLENEEILTYEIAYTGGWTENVSINANVFHNQLDKLVARIIEQESDGSFIAKTSNAGRVDATGLELGGIYLPSNDVKIEASLTYQDVQDKRPGFSSIDQPYSPELLGYFDITYAFTDNIRVGSVIRHVGEMEAQWEGAPEAIPSEVPGEPNLLEQGGRIGKTRGAYTLVDVSISYDMEIGDNAISTMLAISNVFDKKYNYPTPNLNTWADKGWPGEERRFDVSIIYTF